MKFIFFEWLMIELVWMNRFIESFDCEADYIVFDICIWFTKNSFLNKCLLVGQHLPYVNDSLCMVQDQQYFCFWQMQHCTEIIKKWKRTGIAINRVKKKIEVKSESHRLSVFGPHFRVVCMNFGLYVNKFCKRKSMFI